jgi:hypothetical protein
MIGGAHQSVGCGEWQRRLEAGHFPAMEAEIGQGTGAARGPTRLGEEGGSLGRSGPARQPGSAGLIS